MIEAFRQLRSQFDLKASPPPSAIHRLPSATLSAFAGPVEPRQARASPTAPRRSTTSKDFVTRQPPPTQSLGLLLELRTPANQTGFG
jgi:hypothetical protein